MQLMQDAQMQFFPVAILMSCGVHINILYIVKVKIFAVIA